MKPSVWMWRVAAASLSGSLFVFALPALASVAAVSIGDVTFGWGHVLVLIAAAGAWGDSRARQNRSESDIKDINRKLDALLAGKKG